MTKLDHAELAYWEKAYVAALSSICIRSAMTYDPPADDTERTDFLIGALADDSNHVARATRMADLAVQSWRERAPLNPERIRDIEIRRRTLVPGRCRGCNVTLKNPMATQCEVYPKCSDGSR